MSNKGVLIGGFFLIIILMVWNGIGVITQLFQPQKTSVASQGSVIFMQPDLLVFSDHVRLNQFPDKIQIHYPYLLVITPGEKTYKTLVYSLTEQKRIKQFAQVLLDYNGNDSLTTDGKETFFNTTNLKTYCSQGYIQSSTRVLCETPKSDDPLDNKLIAINPKTLEKDDVYSSRNLLGSLTIIQNTLYIAEQNISTHKHYLTGNGKTAEIPLQADIIYPMGKQVFVASFKVTTPFKEARYDEVFLSNTGMTTRLQEQGRIILFKTP